MTKTNKVLKMLAEGRTTSKLTVIPMHVGNLGDCVMKLRRRGWHIVTVTDIDGDGVTYAKYAMPSEAQRTRARDILAGLHTRELAA